MAYVITAACIGTKDTSCTNVCPVDCIHPTPAEGGFAESEQLYIDPDVCIDCGACEVECPVEAIEADYNVPDDMKEYIEKNANYYKK